MTLRRHTIFTATSLLLLLSCDGSDDTNPTSSQGANGGTGGSANVGGAGGLGGSGGGGFDCSLCVPAACEWASACVAEEQRCEALPAADGIPCDGGTCLAGVCDTAVKGSTYYVDASATSTTGDGSEAAPWKSISQVHAALLQPGDRVLFRRGQVWNEALFPVSGLLEAPVWYGAYGSGANPVLGGLTAEDVRYVNVEHLDFEAYDWAGVVGLVDCDHVSITDSVMTYGGTAWAAVRLDGSTFNRFVGCTIINEQTNQQGDTLSLVRGSGHNLVESCTVRNGTHSSVALAGADDTAPDAIQRYNVLRDNHFESAEGRPLELMTLADWNVVERNVVVGGTNTSSTTGFCIGGQNFKMVTSHNIIRGNVMRDSSPGSETGLGMAVYQYQSYPPNQAVGNHVYHNTLLNLANDPISIRTFAPGVASARENHFKNNIVAHTLGSRVLWVESEFEGVADNHFESNLFFQAGATDIVRVGGIGYSVEGVEAALPNEFSNNLQADPELDAAHQPGAGSLALGAAAALTHVVGPSGSGMTLLVADAGYFSAGFGITAPDTIVVGTTSVPIEAIDYETNTLTLLAPIAWSENDPVRLGASGASANIGAL